MKKMEENWRENKVEQKTVKKQVTMMYMEETLKKTEENWREPNVEETTTKSANKETW